jgi:hypothetical protein
MKTNTNWEILTDKGAWCDFSGVIRSVKKLQYIRCSKNKGIWASRDHVFFINGNPTKLKHIPKRSKIDGINGTKISIEKTNRYKIGHAYDIVGCSNSSSHYVIEDNILTHNCDEFAFVKPNIQEAFWSSISPTLATGGQCIMSSTPNGNSNLFARIWRKAVAQENEFKAVHVKWDEPPGRDEEFKAKEIARIGEQQWLQEYECMFLSSERLLIDSLFLHTIEGHVGPPKIITPKYKFEFWKPLKSHTMYLIGVDPSTGTGEDYSVIQLVEFPSFEQVGMFRSNTVSAPFLYLALKALLFQIDKVGAKAYFSVENNGIGHSVISLYEADENPPKYAEFVSQVGKGKLGMTTTQPVKLKMCLNFKQLLEGETLKIRSVVTLEELKTFVRKGGSFEAQKGCNDDTISALLIIMRLVEEISSYEDAAFETLYKVREDGGTAEEYDESDQPLPMIAG